MGGGKWRGRGKGERWREGERKGRSERGRQAGRERYLFSELISHMFLEFHPHLFQHILGCRLRLGKC